MITTSEVTGITYDDNEVNFFRNIYQSAFFLSKNATLIDLFTDSKGKLVFVFLKSEHDFYNKLWMQNKENKEM